MVTVHAQSRSEAKRAADILDECGAIDMDREYSSSSYSGAGHTATGYAGTAQTIGDRTGTRQTPTDQTGTRHTDTARNRTGQTATDRNRTGRSENEETLKVIEEEMNVGKRDTRRNEDSRTNKR